MSRVDRGSSLYASESVPPTAFPFLPQESEKVTITTQVQLNEGQQGQTKDQPRAKRIAGHLPCVGVSLFFLAIVVGIIATGVSFTYKIQSDENRHGLKRNVSQAEHFSTPGFYPNEDHDVPVMSVIINLNDFDTDRPSIEYDIYTTLLVSNESHVTYVCVQIFDLGSPQLPVSLAINEPGHTTPLGMNTASTWGNISTDGILAHYPFDVYTGTLGIIAIAPFNLSTTCDEDFLDESKGTVISTQYSFGQNIQGFGSRNQADYPNKLGYMQDGSVVLTFVVRRYKIIQFFAVIMFIATWLLTAGILMATAQVIVSEERKQTHFDLVAAGTALLFALPSLRSAQPGIPDIPTVYDVTGYFWNVALLSLSTFGLICHSIYRLQFPHPDGKQT